MILDMNMLSQAKKIADVNKTLVNDADMADDDDNNEDPDDKCNKLDENMERRVLLGGIEEVGEAHQDLFNSYHNH